MPPQIAQYIKSSDLDLLTHLISFRVERFEINAAGTDGDPRSVRITFEFGPNDLIEDAKLVKELRYRHSRDGAMEGFVSDPVPIKWKSEKKDLTRGLGPSAVALFEAEKAVRFQIGGEDVDAVSREGLWQNEKLLQGLTTMEELGQERLGFFGWFYYRGVDLSAAVDRTKSQDDVVDDESNDGLRDAEIYPDGSDLACSLAEHLWEDAVDIYGKLRLICICARTGLTRQIVETLRPSESDSSDEADSVADENGPTAVQSILELGKRPDQARSLPKVMAEIPRMVTQGR